MTAHSFVDERWINGIDYLDSGEINGLKRCTWCHGLMLSDTTEKCNPKGYTWHGCFILTPYIPLMISSTNIKETQLASLKNKYNKVL